MSFTTFGEIYPFGWELYRGDRIAIVICNNQVEAGLRDETLPPREVLKREK